MDTAYDRPVGNSEDTELCRVTGNTGAVKLTHGRKATIIKPEYFIILPGRVKVPILPGRVEVPKLEIAQWLER